MAFLKHSHRIWLPEGGRPAGEDWRGHGRRAFVRRRERLRCERFPQFDV